MINFQDVSYPSKAPLGSNFFKEALGMEKFNNDKYSEKIEPSHVSAAIQLAREGKSEAVGEGVEYIFTNAGHTNPLCSVIPLALVEKDIDYDKEKYWEVLLEAAETVLGYFGFDRTLYGDSQKKIKKWWQRGQWREIEG